MKMCGKDISSEKEERMNIILARALIKDLYDKGMINKKTYDAIVEDTNKMIEKLGKKRYNQHGFQK